MCVQKCLILAGRGVQQPAAWGISDVFCVLICAGGSLAGFDWFGCEESYVFVRILRICWLPNIHAWSLMDVWFCSLKII